MARSNLSPRSFSNSTLQSTGSSSSGSPDLDIDSDNTRGFNLPERDNFEDSIEDDPNLPGKILIVNVGDIDQNSVPNFADGIDLFGNDAGSGGKFVPMVLQLSKPIDDSTLRIKITYSASDPAGITRVSDGHGGFTYTPAPGALRIWLVDGNTSRSVDPVDFGGDFVDSGVEYIPSDLGFDSEHDTITLYLESIQASSADGDQRILVESIDVSNSGSPKSQGQDAIRVTSRSPELDVYPDTEEQPHTLPADQPQTWIIATAFLKNDPSNPDYFPNGTLVEWEIEGAGGSFDQTDSTIQNGTARAKFRGNTTAGATFIIKARLPEYGIEGLSGTFQIVPGLTTSITFLNTAAVLLPVDGQTFDVIATLRDVAGNLVEDGTNVEWYDYGVTGLVPANEAAIDSQTTNGKAKATFMTGPLVETDTPIVAVSSDGFTNSTTLDLSPVTVTLLLVATTSDLDVYTGQTGQLRATFFHSSGAPVSDGWPVYWRTTNGTISGASFSTVNGVATATLSAAGGRRGPALVSVVLGGTGGPGTNGIINFKSSAPASMEMSPRYVTPDDGSNLGISGPPNWRAAISVDISTIILGHYACNNFISSPGGSLLPDDAWGNHGHIGGSPGLDSTLDWLASAPYSLALNGTSDYVAIPHVPRLAVKTNLTLNITFRLAGAPAVGGSMTLASKSGEYALTVANDGQIKVRFRVQTTSGSAFAEVSGILVDQRYGVTASFGGGLVSLSVGSGSASTALAGLLQSSGAPIGMGADVVAVVGSGAPWEPVNITYTATGGFFHGNLDEFTIQTAVGLVVANNDVPLDSSGNATVALTAPDLPSDPDGSNGTVHVFRISVHVYNPDNPAEEIDITDQISGSTTAFVVHAKDAMAVKQDIREQLLNAEHILEKIGRGLIAADDFAYLSRLGSNTEIDYVKTTWAIVNCASVVLGVVSGPFRLVAGITEGVGATRASLAISRLYRMTVMGRTVLDLAQLGELVVFLSTNAPQWFKAVPSQREMIKLNNIYQAEK